MNKRLMFPPLVLAARNLGLICIAAAILCARLTVIGAPSVDFVAPPLGARGPITGHVSGLEAPTGYMVLLLTSQNNNIWWDKTHNVHGIAIAEDGTFTTGKGWINHTNVLKAPYIGIWVVPTNFGKFSAEGVALPQKIPLGAVAANVKNRQDPEWRPDEAYEAKGRPAP
jgi:hypothetical protein